MLKYNYIKVLLRDATEPITIVYHQVMSSSVDTELSCRPTTIFENPTSEGK